jgi:DNA-directed RNA polymerase specialized sigma24 family protein
VSADDVRQEAIARAWHLGLDLKAMRAAVGVKSRERAVLVRSLHEKHGMTHKDIGSALGLSGPRVHEIIHGPRKRKPREP